MVLPAIVNHIKEFFAKHCPAITSRLDPDLTETREPFREYHELVYVWSLKWLHRLSEDPEYDKVRHIASYTVIGTTLKFHAISHRGIWARTHDLKLYDGLIIDLLEPDSMAALDQFLNSLLEAADSPFQ